MVTSISPSAGAPIRGLSGLKELNKSDARHVLTSLQAQVAGKSGVLKLMHTGKDQDMVFERKSWYQIIARRQGKIDNTATALKTLYERAGLSEKARSELDIYLNKRGNKAGGSSLARLIQGHLKAKPGDAVMNQVLPKETNHNWVMAGLRTEAALEKKGYHHRFVFSKATGHCDKRVFEQTLADTLVWIWRGYHAD